MVLCLYCVMWVCVNGPSKRAKELFVMSVRETSAVGFLADWFCTPEEIEQIELSKQAVVTDEVDTSLIVIDKKPTEDTDNQNKQVTDKKEDEKEKEPEEPIEIINVSGSTYKGLMMIVKDPSRVKVGTSSATYSSDVPGKRVEEMIAKRAQAKKEKDFAKADAIRNELLEKGTEEGLLMGKYTYGRNQAIESEARIYDMMSCYYYIKNQFDDALSMALMALPLCEKSNDDNLLADCINNIGILYQRKGLFGQAINYMERVYKLDLKAKDKQGMSSTMNNLATLYLATGQA